MRTLYHAYVEEHDSEGMFDSDGTLLGYWSGNDATWRNEYFSPFMKRIGFDVAEAPEWMVLKLLDIMNEEWGEA